MDIKSLSAQLVRSLPSQKSSAVITVFLLCIAAYQLATITWLLFPQPASVFRWVPQAVNGVSEHQQVDLSSLLKLNLFGEYQSKQANSRPAVPTPTEAPKTSLKLTLSGLVASSDLSKSLAIIENKGKQQTYGLDETIQGTQAVIKEIQVDRVILLHRGAYESLLLDPDSKARTSSSGQRRQPAPAPKIATPLEVDVKEVLQDPSKLTDYIRISPVQQDGALRGYRVNPGKDQAVFKQVGLQPGDLAVALNGYDLRDNAQAMQVMQELADLTEISITVERDGQLQDIFFSLPNE